MRHTPKSLWIGCLIATALGVPPPALGAAAEDVYRTACALCHDAGVGGAPRLGDKAAWAQHLKQGKDVLYKIAIDGKPGTAMIAKGGHASLSDVDVKTVVDYMIEKAQ